MRASANVHAVGVRAVALGCDALRVLDIGFCRALDDFSMKEILDTCTHLERLSVFGCNRVTVCSSSAMSARLLMANLRIMLRPRLAFAFLASRRPRSSCSETYCGSALSVIRYSGWKELD